MWDVALQVLRVGSDVILDWNQWNRQRRALWKDRALEAGYAVSLRYVRTPLEVAIRQAEPRAAQDTPWAHRLDAAQILQFSEIFEEPSEDDGLRIILA
ncbi:putative kinase [Arthrobacter sp. CAN_A212]